MKTFQLTGPREMSLLDAPDPQIVHPTDVLLKLGAVGVCGSDIHYYTSGRIGDQVVAYPFTVGHECAGTVVEVGSEVTSLATGDRVAIEPAVTCGHCDQCVAGRENTCRNNRFLGCPGQIEGSLSEYLVMPDRNCFPIDNDLDMGAATVSEPLAIGIYTVRQSGLADAQNIGILGMGPIGRTLMLAAMSSGCGSIYGTDKIVERCELALRGGADWVGNPDHEDVVNTILEREPKGLDIVFECCGQQDAVDQAIELLKPGGKLVLVGIPSIDRIGFPPHAMRRKELQIINIRRQRECVSAALDLISQQRERTDQIITHRFSFGETAAAFKMVESYADGVLKAIIDFD